MLGGPIFPPPQICVFQPELILLPCQQNLLATYLDRTLPSSPAKEKLLTNRWPVQTDGLLDCPQIYSYGICKYACIPMLLNNCFCYIVLADLSDWPGNTRLHHQIGLSGLVPPLSKLTQPEEQKSTKATTQSLVLERKRPFQAVIAQPGPDRISWDCGRTLFSTRVGLNPGPGLPDVR